MIGFVRAFSHFDLCCSWLFYFMFGLKKAEEYQEGRGPELHQHVDRLGVQVQGDGLEGRGQHPRVGGQLRVKLETVKLRKKKGMPRDGLVQARITNFVHKFPSLGLARGVANGENKNLSDFGDNVLAGK